MPDIGKLVISLDFELYWGVRDKISPNAYAERLNGAREAIPRMLEIFEQFELHATWATVGFLFAHDRQDFLDSLPKPTPQYADPNLSPYQNLGAVGQSERDDLYHYAPSIIARVTATPGQEIASHTYSHYYCLEEGQTLDAFRADTQAMVDIARRDDLRIKCIIFPRHQMSADHLEICRAFGIETFRGTPIHWAYQPTALKRQSLLRRGIRLIDSYIPLLGYHTYPGPTVMRGVSNVPASLYFRAYNRRLRLLEPLKLYRIRNAMRHAARHGEIFHIWWHPEDFGQDVQENIRQLHDLAQFFSQLHDLYGMISCTMTEATQSIH